LLLGDSSTEFFHAMQTPAGDRIMAVHTKPAEAPAAKPLPKSVLATPKEQPKKAPLNKRQLAALAAQAKPKQVSICQLM